MLRRVINFTFEYETEKVVQIHSYKIGAMFRFIQLCVIVYFIFWVMIKERGYQDFELAVSGVTAKIKGISYTDGFKNTTGQKLWDAADYVIPPQQKAAFFIATNLVVTRHQTQSKCPEATDIFGATCNTDDDCVEGDLIMLGNGRKTGRCVTTQEPHENRTLKVCEIFGWCPTEKDVLPMKDKPLIQNAPNFTVLLKNSIEFPAYGVRSRNILPWMDNKFFYKCKYDPDHPRNKYCPIFRLGDIVRFGGDDSPDLWIKGGMVAIYINWECDLDYSVEYCLPVYSFKRLDSKDDIFAKGWNFRYSYKSLNRQGEQQRTLIKAYGIQFFITVYGKAYKFDWYTLTMNIGSGIGLLGIATVICDMVLLHFISDKSLYKDAKVHKIKDTMKLKQHKLDSQDSNHEQINIQEKSLNE